MGTKEYSSSVTSKESVRKIQGYLFYMPAPLLDQERYTVYRSSFFPMRVGKDQVYVCTFL